MSVYSQIAWSAAGLALGFLIGFIVRGIVLRAAPHAAVDADPATIPTGRRREGWNDHWGSTLIGLVLLGLAGATTWQLLAQAHTLRELATCDAANNHQFQQALAQRSDAAKATNDAQRQFLSALSRPGASAAERLAAEQTYIDALNVQDAAQDANPLVVHDCGGG